MDGLSEYDIQYRATEALDRMQGIEAAVAHRRYLGDHSFDQIASDLGISPEEAAQIASASLRRIKNHVFSLTGNKKAPS